MPRAPKPSPLCRSPTTGWARLSTTGWRAPRRRAERPLAEKSAGCHLSPEQNPAGNAPMLDKPPNLHATSQQAKKFDPALLARFAAIVGEKFAITDPDLQAP